eukprot:2092831-Prymnesium_polylepis.1
MRRRETAADEPTRRRDAAATDQGASTDQDLSLVTDTDAALEEDQLVIEQHVRQAAAAERQAKREAEGSITRLDKIFTRAL